MENYGYNFKHNDLDLIKIMVQAELNGFLNRIEERQKLTIERFPEREVLIQQMEIDKAIILKSHDLIDEMRNLLSEKSNQYNELLIAYYQKCAEAEKLKPDYKENIQEDLETIKIGERVFTIIK